MNRLRLLSLAAFAPLVFAACASSGQQSVPYTQPAPLAQPAPEQPASVVQGAQANQPASAATVKTVADSKLGNILVDANGMTLYLYTRDSANVSNCYDQCAVNWPPLLATSDAPTLAAGVPGQLGVTSRKDGTSQATYNGTPLYYWVKDVQPGDTTGQNFGGVWFVVPPAAAEGTSGAAPAQDAAGYSY